jgi:HK97 family phage prohead protease
VSEPSWRLADLREEQPSKRSPVLYRSVAADYSLSENGNAANDGRTLTGHFAVFNRWTEIQSAIEGHFMERISPGAFRKTIQESGRKVQVLFSHGRDPQLGLMTLGRVRELAEDERGVRYTVDLFAGLPQLLLEGLRAGTYGASFRAKLVKDRFHPKPGRSARNPEGIPESTVTELQLREFGPVALPAYGDTTAEIRSVTDVYVPQVRVAAAQNRFDPSELPDPKPDWYLGDLREPHWKLKRKDRHALASSRTA